MLKILIDSNEDRLFVVYNNGFSIIFDAFSMLHIMYHEATACHVTGEIVDLISIFADLVKAVRLQRSNSEITAILSRWKDMADMTNRLLTLCNSFTPPEVKEVCIAAVREMLMLWPQEMTSILTPALHRSHSNTGDSDTIGLGPYFPRRSVVIGPQLSATANLKTVRPPRPFLQMSVPSSQLEAQHGHDPDYDKALHRYFHSYHLMIDLMVRLAVNDGNLSKMLVDLSAMIGLEGVPIHLQLFPKLWTDIYHTPVSLRSASILHTYLSLKVG